MTEAKYSFFNCRVCGQPRGHWRHSESYMPPSRAQDSDFHLFESPQEDNVMAIEAIALLAKDIESALERIGNPEEFRSHVAAALYRYQIATKDSLKGLP